MPQHAYRIAAVVGRDGKLEMTVPLPSGTPVEVLVLTPPVDEYADLVEAAGSSTSFWDNTLDDEDWNNA